MPIIHVNYLPVNYSIAPKTEYYHYFGKGIRKNYNFQIHLHSNRKGVSKVILSKAMLPKIEAATGLEYLKQILAQNPADVRIAEEITKQWYSEMDIVPREWHVDPDTGNWNLDRIFFWGTIFFDEESKLYVASFDHDVVMSGFVAFLHVKLHRIDQLCDYELKSMASPCFPPD